MKKRVGLYASTLLGVAAMIVLAAVTSGSAQDAQITGPTVPVDVDTAGLKGPVQPVFYRHDIHVTQYEMDCRYCHFAAEISSSPGLPTMSTCMGCHLLAGAGNPEVEKMKAAVAEQRPIEWVEVHELSSFVRFPHHRHVNSEKGVFEGLEPDQKCLECHGPVNEMPRVYKYATLKMGWCLDCHRESGASQDCTVCHY